MLTILYFLTILCLAYKAVIKILCCRKLCQYNIFCLIVVISYTSVMDFIQVVASYLRALMMIACLRPRMSPDPHDDVSRMSPDPAGVAAQDYVIDSTSYLKCNPAVDSATEKIGAKKIIMQVV